MRGAGLCHVFFVVACGEFYFRRIYFCADLEVFLTIFRGKKLHKIHNLILLLRGQ